MVQFVVYNQAARHTPNRFSRLPPFYAAVATQSLAFRFHLLSLGRGAGVLLVQATRHQHRRSESDAPTHTHAGSATMSVAALIHSAGRLYLGVDPSLRSIKSYKLEMPL